MSFESTWQALTAGRDHWPAYGSDVADGLPGGCCVGFWHVIDLMNHRFGCGLALQLCSKYLGRTTGPHELPPRKLTTTKSQFISFTFLGYVLAIERTIRHQHSTPTKTRLQQILKSPRSPSLRSKHRPINHAQPSSGRCTPPSALLTSAPG